MTESHATSNGSVVIKNVSSKKESRKKKKKKKSKKLNFNKENKPKEEITETAEEQIEIEYVIANPLEGLDVNDPAYEGFSKVFEHFTLTPELDEEAEVKEAQELKTEGDASNLEGEDGEGKKAPSKKQKKKEKRLSIAVLKQLVIKPDVVETWDVTSADPALLVYLKSYRNSVHVPRHWNQKRKYLQGKRGIEKPPFQLPDFIAATGISKIRAAIQEKEDAKKMKQKQREKMQPKMGKMDIDYQVLHDAFFRYQTKPKLTIHGDLYYEAKEFEITMKEKKPGQLSEDLKKALGMPEGAPPPWLINMQRYGPPPSYPNLKIPGLNAPIPEGCRYGYHPGGWGKPPVDEYGRPLYGDVFGIAPPPPPEISQPIDKSHWGELLEQEEEEAPEEEEEGEEEEEPPHPSGIETPSGFETPSGMETPESLELRKAPSKKEEEDDSGKKLFQIIEQSENTVGTALYGSSHKYVIQGDKKEPKNKNQVDLIKSQKTEKMEITLDPSEVEHLENLNKDVLSKKFDQAMQEKQKPKEDVSDLLAEHASKKKRKKDSEKDSKSKKYKDFKF